MWKQSLGLLASIISGVNAQITADFSNNLITDLGPLISLLGERMTQQFLSESTTYLDCLILSLAPIGIITMVVSVIRVCGSQSLRAFIGRAQEGYGTIEAELCTSTSRDVCELFNNGGITRVLGKPIILEIVYVPERDSSAIAHDETNRRSIESQKRIFLFRDYLKNHSSSNESESEDHRIGDWCGEKTEDLEFPPNPNLTLNIGIKRRPDALSYGVACLGFVLQSGVLIVAAMGAFRFPMILEKASRLKIDEDYTSPNLLSKHDSAVAFTVGTIAVDIGVFACALLVGLRTRETRFRRRSLPAPSKIQKSQLIWIQPGNQVVGDQTFDAFAFVESHEKMIEKYVSSRLATKNETTIFPLLTWVAALVTLAGFICQFIGLRGLGPLVAIGQLTITLIMSFIRGLLRTRNLTINSNEVRHNLDLILGHELDWLAFQLPCICKVHPTPNDAISKANDAKTSWTIIGHRKSEAYALSKSSTCINSIAENRIRLAHLTGHYPPGFRADHQKWRNDMVKVRAKSKQLAQVLCQTAEVLKAGSLSDYSIRVPVSMYHHGFQKEDITLVISAPTELSPGGWRLDSSQIESILGLWLWSLVSDDFTSAAAGRQYSPLPGGISSARIVGAEVVETLVSERDSNLQAQFSLWMGKNVVTIESCMFVFDPLANLACADVWSEDTIKTAGSEVPWMKLAQPEAVRKGKRFFGWVSLQELYENQDSSQLVTHPEIEGSGPVETNAEVTSVQNALKIRLHYVNPTPGSDDSAADTLLSECTRELYTIILTQMVSSVKLGDILTKQRFGQLRLENETVTALEKIFVDPDNNLGDGKDALLCILPAFQSQLNSIYGSDLIPSLIEAATDSRRRGQLRSAEKFLLFAYSLGEKPLDSKNDNSSHKATSEAAFIALGELFRWALSEPSNPDTRKFAYAGTRQLAKMITDKTPRESNWSAFKRSIFARYAALAMKAARENGEEPNLALNLDSYNALWQPELEKLDTVSPRPENKRLGAESEIDDQTLSEIVRPLIVSIENKERTKTLYLLSRLTKKTVEAAKAFMKQAIPLAASFSWSEVVDALLELGLMIDSEDNTRKTALLHFASIGDHIQATRMLQKGARPYHEDQSKNSALLYAARNGHEAVVQLLLRTKDVHASGNAGADLTPLMAAAFEGHLGTVRLLLADNRVDSRMQGRDGFTPFFVAVLNGKVHVVDWYLHEHNISVDDHSLKHSLIAAAWLGHAQVMESLLSESQIDPNLMLPEFPMSVVLDFLARVGTRIDAPPDGGCRTPLSLAAAGGHLNCVRVLLAHDSINVNGITSESFTPLFLASVHNHHETSRSISDKMSDSLNQKPDESFKRLVDKTPIEIALILGHSQILLLLLEQPNIRIPMPARRFGTWSWTGYDVIFGLAAQEGVQSIMKALMSSHYQIQTEAKNASLFIAVEIGHADIVEFLLDSCQCDPNATNVPLKKELNQSKMDWLMTTTPYFAALVTPSRANILRAFLNHPHTDVNYPSGQGVAIWKTVEDFENLQSHFSMLLSDPRIELMAKEKSEECYAISTVDFPDAFGDNEWSTLLGHPKLDWNFLEHDDDNLLCRLSEKGFGTSVRMILSHQGTTFGGLAPLEPIKSRRSQLLVQATKEGYAEVARALLDDGRYVSRIVCEETLSAGTGLYAKVNYDTVKAVLEWLYAACENSDIASMHVKNAARFENLLLETNVPLKTVVDAFDFIISARDQRRMDREEQVAAWAQELAEIPVQ